MIDDLRGRLRAEVQRRREIAEKATPGPWRVLTGGADHWCVESGGAWVAEWAWASLSDVSGEPLSEGDARHIAANDPPSVLRRLAADDKIVDLHRPAPYGRADETGCDQCLTARGWPCPTLLALADGYGISDHGTMEPEGGT